MPARRILAVTGPRTQRAHVERFRRAAADAEFVVVEHPSLDQFGNALKPPLDCVLIFGGDGTLNRYLGLLLMAQVPVLPIASGSGNDFARAVGVPNESAALDCFAKFMRGEAEISAADIASLVTRDERGNPQQKFFACCVNVGLDADAAARANRLPSWLKAHGGYFIGGMGAILFGRPDKYQIDIDGEAFPHELWFIAALNTPTYGGGLHIAPHASITDQRLEYVSCAVIPRWRLFQHIPKLLTGKHIREVSYLDFRTISRLSVQTPAPQPVFADGEFMGYTPIEVSLAQQLLAVLRQKSF